ncbi:MAG: DUF4435 domain-containing protein [Candidatus Dojkabacteria bacterium]|jgi:ABC-type cobalamin/Fe3+-siderophores transport system ATPase subunit
MKLKYGKDENIKELCFETRNCIILAANGMGKSSLTKSIKVNNENEGHTELILANKDLAIRIDTKRNIPDETLSKQISVYTVYQQNRGYYEIDNIDFNQILLSQTENNVIQNDFDLDIEKIRRQHMIQHTTASINYRETGKYKRLYTKAEIICKIWNDIFINRELFMSESGDLKVKNLNDNKPYSIENISDGERSSLYLITKVLLTPNESLIIIDETETHLNSSLLQKLWDKIEVARPDCNFVYVSHDIEFALSRKDCTKFWIKDFCYNQKTWNILEIKEDVLPEELILQIIGSKNEQILFVESTENHDRRLYEILYSDFKVVSVGSCQEVINYTKVLNGSNIENYKKTYYGLIDRDFKSQEEIEELKKSNIYTLNVAEWENLFFSEEVVLEFFTEIMGGTDSENKEIIRKLKEEVFKLKENERFKSDFYKNLIIAQFNKSLQEPFDTKNFHFKPNYKYINQEWNSIITENSYEAFLAKLNCKEIKSVTKIFKYSWKNYYRIIMTMVCKNSKMKELFLKQMPQIEEIKQKKI